MVPVPDRMVYLTVGQLMTDTRESILAAARRMAQAHGYGGLNFRDLAAEVGIRSASLYHHFASKADLGAAVARRYWEDTEKTLEAFRREFSDPTRCLRHYPDLFRTTLADHNRMCLAGFMSAEADDLPEIVRAEVRRFSDVHVRWLSALLGELDPVAGLSRSERRAFAIFAAVSGAQLVAHGRASIEVYDDVIEGCRETGLFASEPIDASSREAGAG